MEPFFFPIGDSSQVLEKPQDSQTAVAAARDVSISSVPHYKNDCKNDDPLLSSFIIKNLLSNVLHRT